MTTAYRTQVLQTDPKASYLAYKDEIDAAIQKVLDSGFYILGEEVEAFEQEFADYIGVQHGIGVANGTDALEVALRACGVGPGDVVLTVSHTAVATVAAIELVGATPAFVDINPTMFTMDVAHLEEAIIQIQHTPSLGTVKAIIPVHLYGYPVDMPALMEIAERYNLYVIEDCAQAHGAMLNGCKVGTWGHMAAFSLYPTKNLGAIGDGGIVVTASSDLAERAKGLRQYGWKERYISDIAGMNSRLDVLQAAILRVKLKHLDEDNQKRRAIAQTYAQRLAHLPLQLPFVPDDVSHVYHQFVLRVQDRDAMLAFLKQRGIGAAIHYPAPVHLQPAYQSRIWSFPQSLSVTEHIGTEILSLPMHPFMTADEVEAVITGIEDWYRR